MTNIKYPNGEIVDIDGQEFKQYIKNLATDKSFYQETCRRFQQAKRRENYKHGVWGLISLVILIGSISAIVCFHDYRWSGIFILPAVFSLFGTLLIGSFWGDTDLPSEL